MYFTLVRLARVSGIEKIINSVSPFFPFFLFQFSVSSSREATG